MPAKIRSVKREKRLGGAKKQIAKTKQGEETAAKMRKKIEENEEIESVESDEEKR